MKLVLAILAFMAISSAYAIGNSQVINLIVTEKGFVPSIINVKAGTNVELKITRKTDSTCATEIQVPSKKIKKKLPLNKTVSIEIGKVEEGEISFGCGMNMVTGVIFVK
ncbi:MAG: cupredoxin domain-containing protein [Bacteriovorax sp.]|nr:cupredoxin domain-containing protein [Bacteriovorax sp.]